MFPTLHEDPVRGYQVQTLIRWPRQGSRQGLYPPAVEQRGSREDVV